MQEEQQRIQHMLTLHAYSTNINQGSTSVRLGLYCLDVTEIGRSEKQHVPLQDSVFLFSNIYTT
jgi:hypothetical protein